MHFRTKAEAEANGRKWKATLPAAGRGWTLRVWDNLGWHWSLTLGPLSVYPWSGREDGHFHAMLAGGVGETRYGDGRWTGQTFPRYARSPLAAAKKAIAHYRDYAKSQRKNLDELDQFFVEKSKLLGDRR